MISNFLFSGHWKSPGSMSSFVGSTSRAFKSNHSIKMTSFSDVAFNLQSQSSMMLSTINAWSVDGITLNASDSASTFFAISLFPYLAMLFFLSKKETKTPSLTFFGFCFLLVFVAATIPAGIYAKYTYNDILANVDWLHGSAESLLTITNILIITGFRQSKSRNNIKDELSGLQLQSNGIVLLGALLGVASLLGSIDFSSLSSQFRNLLYLEPLTALSLPTWMVHSSSILEWLIAMTLVWDQAYTSSNPRWKGLTIAMIPAHASGMCACAFHFFFNNPDLYWMVALQAGLTFVGNTCMAAAAYRIYDYERTTSLATVTPAATATATTATALEGSIPSEALINPPPTSVVESDVTFFTKLFLKSALLAGVVKYGELFLDFPFTSSDEIAAAVITAPVLVNTLQWVQRSIAETDITYH